MTQTIAAPQLVNPPAEVRTGPRWIRRRLKSLDPQRDYTEIVKLTTLFHVNDFIADWAFTHIMCRATTGHSSKAIVREGSGKLLTKTDLRFDDTTDHFLVWNEFGPDAPQTKRSVGVVNGLHAKFQKVYPSAFDDVPLWVYVIAWEVAGLAILATEFLGLPDLDPKEKEAKAVWGRKLAELFIDNNGSPVSELMPDLHTFEDFVAFVHEYESQPWAPDANSTTCAEAVLEKYAKRHKWLPRPLAHALVKSFWHEGQFECNGLDKPSWFWRTAAKNFMRAMLIGTALKPSPKESLLERKLRKLAESGQPLPPILRASVKVGPVATSEKATSSGCPMGFVMTAAEQTSTTES
jgi:hypothetical protein